MPSRPYFSDTVVPGLYVEVKVRVISELEGAISVALTTDAWSSKATMSYVTVTAHFIMERWTLEERVLETHHVPESHTVTNLGDALYATAERWAIIRNHGIHAVVTDNASNVIAVVAPSGLDPHIGCFAHYLNLVALKALGTQVLSRLLGRVRRIVSYFHRSNIASHTLEEKQAQLGLAPSVAKSKKLIIDVKTRWNSAFNLLVHYSELEMAVLAALASPEIKNLQTDVDTLNKTDIDNLHKAIHSGAPALENCHCGFVWGRCTNCFNDPAVVTYTHECNGTKAKWPINGKRYQISSEKKIVPTLSK